MLGTARIRSDERQVNPVFERTGEGDLRLFRFLLDALEGIRLLAQLHSVSLFEFGMNPIHDPGIPIISP